MVLLLFILIVRVGWMIELCYGGLWFGLLLLCLFSVSFDFVLFGWFRVMLLFDFAFFYLLLLFVVIFGLGYFVLAVGFSFYFFS